MSTGNAVLSALLLCSAAAGASGSALEVIMSRAVLYSEVECALALIPPLFQRADNDSAAYPPRLFVFGKADWLDKFLRGFPSVATIYLFTAEEENIAKFKDFLLAEMMPSASIALRFVPDAGNHVTVTVPIRVRYITWTSFDSDLEANAQISRPTAWDSGNRFYLLMVTARPRGTTHVFYVPMLRNPFNVVPMWGELLGVWSPDAGWSAPHTALFPPLCASWRPPRDGEPMLAEMFLFSPTGIAKDRTLPVYMYSTTEEYEILRLLRDSYGLVFQTKAKVFTEAAKPYGATDTCRLDALAFINGTFAGLEVLTHSELSLFPWVLDNWICVVPAGAGKPRPVLYPLTAEYTPAVWAALLAVVLTVVACLYLVRRDESVQELVLQALSPLLGQPLEERRAGPQIAVLGGWLLTCVVVVAGYQGQLLGFITVPSQNGEINSWQEWLESDLVLLVGSAFSVADVVAQGLHGLTEDRVVREAPWNYLKVIATQRNASVLVSKYHSEVSIRDESNTNRFGIKEYLRKVHTFAPNLPQNLISSFVTSKGSPFEVPLRKILGRIHAAGGLRRNHNNHLPQATVEATVDSEDKPISLRNVMPVFAAYVIGNILAVITFLLEQFFYYRK
ncbi:Ionotropic receptor 260 [Frankliniella occidentalis]|nr:Ionotropic receptor 260 [Frankliniella occidentalis]